MDPLTKLLHSSYGYPSKESKDNLKLCDFTEKHESAVIGGVYWINEILPTEFLDLLECKPHKNSLAPSAPKTFSVCYKHPTKPEWIGLPRFLGLSKFGLPLKDIRNEGLENGAILKRGTKLHDYQQRCRSQTLETLDKWGGATIIADCGAGKTLMALSIAVELKRKTLVLCNRSFLMQQWKYDIVGKPWTWSDDNSEVKEQKKLWRLKCPSCKHTNYLEEEIDQKHCIKCQFELLGTWIESIEPRNGWLENVRVGWLQGSSTENIKTFDIENKDFVIASIESVSQCNYSKDVLSQFGMVIVDEMHHLGALTLSQVLPLLPCKYVLGISATPERNDGLEHVLYWLAGPTSFVYKRLPSITGLYNTVKVQQLLFDDGEKKEIVYASGQIGFAQMVSCLSQDLKRNNLILEHAKSFENERKKILIVTSIVDHAKYLCEKIKEFCSSVVVIHGGCKPAQITVAKSDQAKYVVATFQFLEEGYDDNKIDTLIMALPRSKIQQVVGRCERTHAGKLVPLVIDIVDTFSVFEAMSWKRHSFYKSRGFEIQRLRNGHLVENQKAKKTERDEPP
jgi:superfamily II DNA or RNA helicase